MEHNNVWHGTEAELMALVDAVNHNCVCRSADRKPPVAWCDAHQMLFQNQRAVDGLLFARNIADRLRAEEFQGQACIALPAFG